MTVGNVICPLHLPVLLGAEISKEKRDHSMCRARPKRDSRDELAGQDKMVMVNAELHEV